MDRPVPRNAVSQWKWSHGNETASYRAFTTIPWLSEHCAYTNKGSKTWYTDPCDNLHSFSCFDERMVLVRENKTWEEALRHCRSLGRVSTNHSTFTHLYDLASLITDDDHTLAREKAQNATTDEVWTGLRFLAGQWWWLDRGPMLYRDIDRCPTSRSCGVIEKKGTTSFSTRNCEERRNFICYKRF
ncbi:struthiocalcin-1-like [Salarias fasciatus]|uniref:struthiocalcin-1-like n=1 Tax=Salarias fasciatus TaxID=181472 RepID=UPI001176ABD9|nr:struthiocalcin-1-like [Salarias fasciatus]